MAKEYIEREALVKDMRDYADRKAVCGHIELANGILKGVGRAEDFPAADVVEVVRCKDCKHGSILCEYDNGDVLLDCIAHGGEIVAPDDYCSDGERRDGGA